MPGQEYIKKAYESILHGNYEQAVEWFDHAILMEPNNADFRYRLSITLARNGRLELALQHAEQACLLDGEHEEYRLHRDRILAMQLLKEAEQLLHDKRDAAHQVILQTKEALRLDPLAVEAYMISSMAYAALNQFDEALQAVKEALKLEPQNDTAQQLFEQYRLKLHHYMNEDKQT